MKYLLSTFLVIFMFSCSVKNPIGKTYHEKGIITKVLGKGTYRAIYVNKLSSDTLDNGDIQTHTYSVSLKICNYIGSKKEKDTIEFDYIVNKYQKDFLKEY